MYVLCKPLNFVLLQGGMYVLQLFDNYAATYSLLFIGLVECMTLSWVYGEEFHLHLMH